MVSSHEFLDKFINRHVFPVVEDASNQFNKWLSSLILFMPLMRLWAYLDMQFTGIMTG